MEGLYSLINSNKESLYENVIKDGLNKRILIFNQEVTDDIIEDYSYYIIKWNMEDKNIPTEKRKKITILINSPGGDCITGFNMVDIISNSKTPVVAIGMGLVASMAYHLFIGCHERYAFENTVFLQHDGDMEISNSSSKFKDTVKFFNSMEERTKQYVLEHTKIESEYYDKVYGVELYMYSDQAKKLGCVDGIIGEDISLEDIL